jgi:predicted AlkP superfamily pyrophosphatase or phosphodiesterase
LYVGWVLKLAPGSTAPAAAPSPEAAPAPAAPVATGRVERVLIISIDGLRPDSLFATPAPNIHALANRGAYTWAAQTIDPPTTLQAHASMLSGMTVAGHGIDWNAHEPGRGTIQVPTVFSIVHNAGGRTVMVISKNKLQHLAAPGTVDTLVNLHDVGDPYVAQRAVKHIGSDFDLMFVHMLEVDDFGHTNGWMSPNYLRGVTQADAAVGTILGGLEKAGKTGTTLVIVTADHGGEGIDHQVSTPATRTIPWVMAGPGVRAGYQLSGIRIMDTAATAVYALGLGVPGNWNGRAVTEAFVN